MGQTEASADSRDRALAAIVAVSTLMARRHKPAGEEGRQTAQPAEGTPEARERALAAAIAVSVLLARRGLAGRARHG